MGYQKNIKPVTKIEIIKTIVIILIVFGLFGALLNSTIKYENKIAAEQALIEDAYVHPDTLHISRDLQKEDNLVKFINNEYPLYEILEYEHIDSDYSAWNGVHNFYEFILIKK